MTHRIILVLTFILSGCSSAIISPTGRQPGTSEPQQSYVKRARMVEVAPAGLTASGRARVDLFTDASLPLVRDEVRQTDRGTVWVGRVEGQPGSTAMFVIRGRVVVGNITTGEGRVYDLRYVGNGVHQVREIDQSRFPPDGPPDAPNVPPRDPQADPCPTTDPATEIDLMVVYNDASRIAAGGTEGMEAEVVLAVEATNQAYINSNINQRISLVHMEEVSYAETGSAVTDRNRLQNVSDGFIDGVHALRNTHGADLVLLITNTPSDYCGYAYIMASVNTSFETFAFADVRRDCAVSNLSFPHELGHLMSARHDWPNDPTNNSPYAYNHGHNSPNAPQKRTMMSTSGGTRVQWFSNPNLNYPGTTDAMGAATGAQQADNHLVLNNTAQTVANFRCTSPGADNVWAKDTWNDAGGEPDAGTAAEDMWKSPYIWVRNSQDASLVHQHVHQNPVNATPNFVYVKLHNGGGATSGTLMVYYANASAGLTWPGSWTLIASAPVAAFAGTSTRIVEVPWTPSGTGHYCLLARWVSASDPMATAEGPDINANVRANNNIVWRNVEVVGLGGDVLTRTVRMQVRNVDRGPQAYSLVLRTPEGQRASFLTEGEVSVVLDDTLAGAWRRGGSRGTGIRQSNQGLIASEGATLDNIVLGPGQAGEARITFRRTASTPRRTYQVDVIQLGAEQQEVLTMGAGNRGARAVVGGVTYEIQAEILGP